MPVRSKSARLAFLVSAAALLPALSAGKEIGDRPATILVTGPTALDVSVAVRDASGRLRDGRCQQVLTTSRTGRAGRSAKGWGPRNRTPTSSPSSSATARSPWAPAAVP